MMINSKRIFSCKREKRESNKWHNIFNSAPISHLYMHVCARVNTLQVESRWPKMNVAIEGGREKRIYACTFFMAEREAQSILYVCCDIATYFIRRWKERKRNLIFLTKDIVKIPSFAVLCFSKNFRIEKNSVPTYTDFFILRLMKNYYFLVFCADCNNVKAFYFQFHKWTAKSTKYFP